MGCVCVHTQYRLTLLLTLSFSAFNLLICKAKESWARTILPSPFVPASLVQMEIVYQYSTRKTTISYSGEEEDSGMRPGFRRLFLWSVREQILSVLWTIWPLSLFFNSALVAQAEVDNIYMNGPGLFSNKVLFTKTDDWSYLDPGP